MQIVLLQSGVFRAGALSFSLWVTGRTIFVGRTYACWHSVH